MVNENIEAESSNNQPSMMSKNSLRGNSFVDNPKSSSLQFARKKSQQSADDRLNLRFIPRRTRSTVSHLSDEHDQWGASELDAKEEHTLILQDNQHNHTLLDRLNAFRRNRELCDVVLFVKEHEILAHKVVLASISNALFDMFVKETDISVTNTANNTNTNAHNSREGSLAPIGENDLNAKKALISQSVGGMTTSDKRYSNYFEFDQGDFDCFEAIVNFAYTSRLEISSWKMPDLYKTAYCLQVIPIANACARYLAENLSVNNCIGIRKQANFNNDVFLAGKVDDFIERNMEKISTESDEFTQLPCIKLRIITDNEMQVDGGHIFAEKSLEYFQRCPRISDRVDQQIEALVEKSHLLIMDEEHQVLQNLCDADDQSSVGSCDIVQDYKRAGQTAKTAGHNSNPIGTQQVQHRVTGAKAVRMNASRVTNAKYASNESLNSVASTTSTADDDEIEVGVIASSNISPGFYIAVVVLYRRIVVLSILIGENDDVIRSINKDCNNSTGVNGARPHNGSTGNVDAATVTTSTLSEPTVSGSETPKLTSFDTHMVNDVTPLSLQQQSINASNGGGASDLGVILQQYRRQPLPPMGHARCSNGATFVNGRIFVIGGYNRGECLSSVEEFDVATEEWSKLPDMLSARGRFDSALEGGMIYAIAGSNGNNDLKKCERYDPKLHVWTEIKSLDKPRSHNGCTSFDGKIYCVGGSFDQNVLRDCERYDPKTDEWTSIAPLQTPRFQGGCTSWRGLIVYCAGCDRWNCLDTVEAYDPRTNAWRYLPKLKTPRRGCAVAVMRDSLYVIGGHDGTQSLTSVEVLDYANASSWRLGPSLNVARGNTHAVVTARGAIYIIGGFNGNQFLDSIEVLENESIGWRNWRKPDKGKIVEEDDESENNGLMDSATHNSKPDIQKISSKTNLIATEKES